MNPQTEPETPLFQSPKSLKSFDDGQIGLISLKGGVALAIMFVWSVVAFSQIAPSLEDRGIQVSFSSSVIVVSLMVAIMFAMYWITKSIRKKESS